MNVKHINCSIFIVALLTTVFLYAFLLSAEIHDSIVRYAKSDGGNWILLDKKCEPVSYKKYKDIVFLRGELSDLILVKEDEVGWSILTSSNEVFSKRHYSSCSLIGDYIRCENKVNGVTVSDLYGKDGLILEAFEGKLGRPVRNDKYGMIIGYAGVIKYGIITAKKEVIYSTDNAIDAYGFGETVIEKDGKGRFAKNFVTGKVSQHYDFLAIAFTRDTGVDSINLRSDKYYIGERGVDQFIVDADFKEIYTAPKIRYLGCERFLCGDREKSVVLGFEDNLKEIKVKNAFAYRNGFACVEIDGLFGYIDESLQLVISCKHTEALDFCEGYAIVADAAEGYYCIDERGEALFTHRFKLLAYTSTNGILKYKANEGAGYCDKNGKSIYHGKGLDIKGVCDFCFQYGIIVHGNSFEIVDKNGEVVASVPDAIFYSRQKDAIVARNQGFVIIGYDGKTIATVSCNRLLIRNGKAESLK